MASELAPGTIVVTGSEVSSGAGAVFRIHPTRGTEAKVSSAGAFVTPIGIALDADGRILVADADAFGGKGGVIRVDPATKKQSTVASVELFANPFDLAVETTGSILVVDPHANGVGGVVRVDPETGKQVMVSSGEETGPNAGLREVGIAVEKNGRILVIEQSLSGGMGGGRVTRIHQKTGARKAVATGGSFTSAAGIAVEADGGILVADANAFGGSGGVIRVHPKTGKQTSVTSGGSLVSPLGIAIEADGSILVADSDAFGGKGGIIRVNPETGEQKKVTSGKKFGGHRRIAVVPSTYQPSRRTGDTGCRMSLPMSPVPHRCRRPLCRRRRTGRREPVDPRRGPGEHGLDLDQHRSPQFRRDGAEDRRPCRVDRCKQLQL